MACKIAENRPLNQMRIELGLPQQCHSLRGRCIKGRMRSDAGYALGAPGAALGYCQALFHQHGPALEHTAYVRDSLKAIGAPWSNSHELFWGYRGQRPISEYLSDAVRPLAGSGRVPILITGLDPGQQPEEISGILRALPTVAPGETILIRVILNDEQSVIATGRIIQELIKVANQKLSMPVWWPLIQGSLSTIAWKRLKRILGQDWKYANVAVNPFTSAETLEIVWEQITVAQVPLGLEEGVRSDGTIKLAKGVKITGAAEEASYSLFQFADALSGLPAAPTLIVLGPAHPDWPQEWNSLRISKLLPVLRKSVEVFWKDLSEPRREAVWKLEA